MDILGSKTNKSPCVYPGKQCIAKGREKKEKTGSFNFNTNEMAKTVTADLSSENNSSIKIYVHIIVVILVITAACIQEQYTQCLKDPWIWIKRVATGGGGES